MDKVTRSYTVIEEIGRGGMAVVYKGWQKFLERPIVIKELLPTSSIGDEFIKRFEREAKLVANLHHENIVTIHDGWKEKEKIYIIMEFIDGVDLKKLLIQKKQFPISLSIYIIWSVTRALEYAHEKKIVHRDIKPANILISRSGNVKLVDFGVARELNKLGLTSTGEMIGTPAYMSPEQVKGEKVDVFTDIFSLGIVAYKMMAGRHPFSDASNNEVTVGNILEKKLTDLRRLNPGVPYDIARIVKIALAKDPKKRYENVGVIRRKLDKYVKRYSRKNLEKDLSDFISDSLPQEKKEEVQKLKKIEIVEIIEKAEDRKDDSKSELVLGLFLMVFLLGCIGLVMWKYVYLYFR